ncbi:MAG: QsdR family transcriptional regulator [Marmoricola sp.]
MVGLEQLRSDSVAMSRASSGTGEQLVEVAVRCFLRDGWIDMRAFAVEAGVGRATVYRHLGARDDVLGEVLWTLTQRSLDSARRVTRAAGTTGAEAVLATLRRSMTDVVSLPALRRLLDRDPETALRVLTSKDGVVQARVVGVIEQLVLDEMGPPHGITSAALAYAITRVAESFCYSDVIAGQAPDIESASAIIGRLLTEDTVRN